MIKSKTYFLIKAAQPVALGDLLLSLGDQEILVFALKLHIWFGG